MKIELGQFYLGSHGTIFIFTKCYQGYYEGTAWQRGFKHKVNINVGAKRNAPYTFIPIDPAIAKMMQATQDPPV